MRISVIEKDARKKKKKSTLAGLSGTIVIPDAVEIMMMMIMMN